MTVKAVVDCSKRKPIIDEDGVVIGHELPVAELVEMTRDEEAALQTSWLVPRTKKELLGEMLRNYGLTVDDLKAELSVDIVTSKI